VQLNVANSKLISAYCVTSASRWHLCSDSQQRAKIGKHPKRWRKLRAERQLSSVNLKD
jgi:hypothetical protein